MKILHATTSMDPVYGGPPRVAARLAAAQAGLGHEVTLLSYGDEAVRRGVAEFALGYPGFDQVKQEFVRWGGWRDRYFVASARRQLRELVSWADVVHLHNVWESLGKLAAKYARDLGKPYFFEPNGLLDVWCMQQKSLKKKIAMAMGFRHMLDEAAGLCLGNKDEADAINKLKLRAPQVIIPLNAIFMEEIAAQPPAGAFGKRYSQVAGKPFMVFLSRLHEKKGLDYLAEGFARFAKNDRDTHLVVIGNDEGAKADFEARIARHGLSDRVHLVGPAHGTAKWEAFRDAMCFVLPSRQEGFSIAITEALAAGLPVIISTECHFPEVAEAGAGEVVPLDAAAVGDAMTRMAGDPVRRRAMANAARELVARKYNCRSAAAALIEVYQAAVQRYRAGEPDVAAGLQSTG